MKPLHITLLLLALAQARVDTAPVRIPVTIHDKDGNVVTNLAKDNFQVFEDKILQDITLFKRDDSPLSLGLIIDNSGSMRNKRERVNNAALSFVREGNPEDQTFIVNFDDAVHVEQEFTGSIGNLMDALDRLDSRGETALYDAIQLSVDKVMKEGRQETKVLLLISDGVDNRSRSSYDDVLKHLKESKVTLYAIGLGEDNSPRGLFRAPPGKKAQQMLAALADATGGTAYFPKALDEIEEICKQIAHELRNRYTIGYTSKSTANDGAWREVKVVVTPPKGGPAKLDPPRHRQGYFSPKS